MPKSEVEYIEDERGCWVWQRAKTTAGYGEFMRDGQMRYAHRHFYEEHKGPIPDGLTIDHLCRNRACCNPDHLEPVTMAENNRRGDAAKLTWNDVREIRALDGWVSQKALAGHFGVAPCSISHIVHKRTWIEGT